MKDVCVLISTYNGEKYIAEQLDSVFQQKNVNLHIIVRDDGSKDSTIKILEKYNKTNECMDLYRGENLGVAHSFMAILKSAPDYDYYAFCDQDDWWDSMKLANAINRLERFPGNQPNLYYSNLYVTDQRLNKLRNFLPSKYEGESKYSILIDNMAAGCTMVFNNSARKLLLANNIPDYILMHDAWIHLICAFFGNVYYDSQPFIKYRQHGNNTVGTRENKSVYKRIKEKWERIVDKNLRPREMLAYSFYNSYKDYFTSKERKHLLHLMNYRKSLKDKIKLLFDFKIKAPNLYRDFIYRILIILGEA